jgi:hypothetical protein
LVAGTLSISHKKMSKKGLLEEFEGLLNFSVWMVAEAFWSQSASVQLPIWNIHVFTFYTLIISIRLNGLHKFSAYDNGWNPSLLYLIVYHYNNPYTAYLFLFTKKRKALQWIDTIVIGTLFGPLYVLWFVGFGIV